MLKQFKRIIFTYSIIFLIAVSLGFTSPQPAFASVDFDFTLPKQIDKLMSNKQIVGDAKRFFKSTPQTICRDYINKLNGIDSSNWAAIEEGATSIFIVTQAVTSASAAGAGSLAGYAGIASAVSQLGLGSLTTTIAGMMGSSVAGAAATAVVTSAVGGPIVMGALLASGTGAATFGAYKLTKVAVENLGGWAESYCKFTN